MRSSRLLYCVLAFCLPAAAWAVDESVQAPESIAAAAERLVLQAMPVPGGKLYPSANRLDARLRLKKCEAGLAPFIQSGNTSSAHVIVGVRCPRPQWTVYVPVSLEVEVPVLVLRQAAGQGAALTAHEVDVQTRRVKGSGSGYLGSVDQLHRRHLKFALPAGTVLTPDVLAADFLVRRGQEVVLLASVGGIEVRAKGVALSDGAASDHVRVQNLSSQKVVEGVVEDESVVRVTL